MTINMAARQIRRDEMLKLLFNNHGRISSRQFIYGGYVLILAAVAFGLLEKSTYASAVALPVSWLTLLGAILVMAAWTCLWIKRLHQGNKNGWVFLVFVAGYGLVLTIVSVIFILIFNDGHLLALAMEHASGTIERDEYYDSIAKMRPQLFLPLIVARAIASMSILHFGDKIIPIDPDENRFGPVGE